MKIRFLSLAEEDLQDAFVWYERQRSGLGYEFMVEFDNCIAHVRRFPEASPADTDGVRRALINRFPYCVRYIIESDFVVIYAVSHLHREPRYWSDRLS